MNETHIVNLSLRKSFKTYR